MQPDPASRSDRRAEPRRTVDLFVNRFLNGFPYLCRATDISRSGMRLLPLIQPMAEAPRFMGLQFQVPGCDEVITASGEAVFADDGGPVGVRFTRLGGAGAEIIDRFVASQ